MRSTFLLLFITVFAFNFISNAQNGGVSQPFTSLGQAQNVTADGVYYFSLSGTNFSTYVRVGGWVQVAIDFRPGTGNLPQSTALNNTVRGILSPSALSTLGSATVTRVLTSNGQLDVQNTRPGIITRIVNNQTLLATPADNTDNNANWTGTNTLAGQFISYGNTTAYGLNQNIFHAGNNGDGVHWIPFFTLHMINNNVGQIPNGEYFQLLVRAPMVAVVTGPVINTQPSTSAQSVCLNAATTALSVSASSPNGSAISYQWYSNASNSTVGGTSIGGATSASYTPPSNVAGTTYYYVICTNNQGSTTSNVSAAISVNAVPQAASNSGTVIDYLVVGGGGGGGDTGGGGGGGGQVKTGSVSLLSGSYGVTIGNGGTGGTSAGTPASNGGTTTLSLPTPVVSIGGGGGGMGLSPNGSSGGNGGGGGHLNNGNPPGVGGTGAVGGFAGGNGNNNSGGGGAGAGGAGISAPGAGGGIGVSSSISGSATFYGGGGGGGSWQTTSTSNGIGGAGGGGLGGITTTTLATSGVANTGGGGGGSGNSQSTPVAKNGGSGIVIVRYLGSPSGTGGTITQVGGYTIHTFNSNGTFAFNNPSSAVVPNVTVCGSTSATFTGTVAAGLTLDWYNAASGGTLLSQGTLTYTTPALASTTTYYVAVRNVSTGCVSATRTAVTATVNTTSFTSTTGASRCGTGTVTLQAATAAGTINWYAALTGGASLGTGTSFTTPSIATTTTYYAEVTNNGCASNPRTAVVATVNAIPTLASTTSASICGTGTATLQATTAAGTINWYAASTGGASLGTGTSYTTPSIASTTTYYAEVTNNGCTSSPRTAVVATVNALPTFASTTGASICGTGTPTLQATTAAGTINWYAALTGGASLGTGTSYTTPSIATTTTYYADVTNNGCTSNPRTAVVATVNAIPALTSTTGASRCGTGTVTLQAATAAGTINWYTALTGGSSLGTGTSYTTSSIATTTTYYAEVTNNGCTSSPRTAVVATVIALPTFSSTTGASICGGPSTLTLQAATAAGTINWYVALIGGASLGTGTSYTTPSLATTTTYYADVTNNGCTSSPRTAVVATVNAIPTITSTTGASICISGTGTLQASTAAGTINWYTTLTGGASLGTGTSYTTPSIATTTTYYADVTNNGCTSSPRTSIIATVIPSSTASNSQTVCPGLLPSPITLTNYGGTLQWQTSNDNATFTNIGGQTSATLPANSIGIMSGTKYIRAMVTNGTCVLPSNVVTLSPANVNVLTALTANSYVWNGQSSSDWGTLSNWYSYNGTSLVPAVTLPSNTSTTIIPANTACILTQPIISTGAVNVNSLVLETGSQLTQSGGTFWVWTNLIKNGNLTSTGGFIVFFGPNSGTISGNGTIQFAKMRVNKSAGATLTLQIPVAVSDSLHMWQGNIYTTTNNLLTLGLNSASPGTLNYNSGTIVGPFKRFFANAAVTGVAGRFPVGTATYNRYAQFGFGTSPGSDQSLTVQYISGPPMQGGTALYSGLPLMATGALIQNYSNDGYWSVIPTNGNYTSPIASVNYDVSLYANNLTGMQTPQICRLIKSPGSNTANQHHITWQSCGTHTAIPGNAIPTAFVITSTVAQGFSWFNIGTSNNQALPVEFSNMTTTCEDNSVQIQWTTESEHNNDYFRIEKSTTGYEWEFLSYVDGVGNSTTQQTYTYFDENQRINNYYRLYQVDMDGSEELLSTLFSECENTNSNIESYPNPSHGSFSIYWRQFKSKGDVKIKVLNTNGQQVFQEKVALDLGVNLFNIKADLAPGVYMIELTDVNNERKLIKHVVN